MDPARQRQTHYGALDVYSGQLLWQSYPRANAHYTVTFLRYLQRRRPGQRLLIFWDRVSYHRYGLMRTFLEQINDGLPPETTMRYTHVTRKDLGRIRSPLDNI